ncbi:hypothetical protein C8A00DRAFT_13636 [Chaetomidium leptoderma]|uniref:F-box domain-containing protein n=1 Tax=Chaetomidium leptoderma TaxID=669021 RepID=A0AAN6VRW0_9PEZI|nr:hypothetical protein C8A00DRAFT_13636 [Chaetomidium leptoderma]
MQVATATAPTPTPTPTDTFLLRLPPSVRHRIYLFLGLASWNCYPNVFGLNGRRDPWIQFPSCWLGLLRSCRAIYADAAAFFYSANRFIVWYSNPGSLEPLRALTPWSIASLTSLKVVLNEASCHSPGVLLSYPLYCCEEDKVPDCPHPALLSECEVHHEGLHRPPLLSPAPNSNHDNLAAAQAMLSEWHSTAAYLSSHISPGCLEFSLVCDIDSQHGQSLDMAKYATEPIHLLPPLKDCHVRLGQTPDSRLQQVAHDAVSQARRITTPYYKPSSSALTTLITLPRELRLRILEHTDLVAPWKEVSWGRIDGTYMIFRTRCGEKDGFYTPPDIHHGCQFRQCWYNDEFAPPIGCFCRRRHATFSSSCKCWAPPGPDLFLICRTLCRDAQYVFFSQNNFIIHDYKSWIPIWVPGPEEVQQSGPRDASTGYYPYERLAASLFFREVIPTHCLSFLRSVEIVYPPFQLECWPLVHHPAIQDWRATVEWLRDKINAPGLTLQLIMADLSEYTEDTHPVDRSAMTKPQGKTILASYTAIAVPLKHLAAGDDGLAGFYTDVAWPWRWTKRVRNRMLHEDGDEWLASKAKANKDLIERYVMGDRYESLYANGKTEPAQSIWRDVYYNKHGYVVVK